MNFNWHKLQIKILIDDRLNYKDWSFQLIWRAFRDNNLTKRFFTWVRLYGPRFPRCCGCFGFDWFRKLVRLVLLVLELSWWAFVLRWADTWEIKSHASPKYEIACCSIIQYLPRYDMQRLQMTSAPSAPRITARNCAQPIRWHEIQHCDSTYDSYHDIILNAPPQHMDGR